jgi:putative endopeptidase
MQTKHNYVFTGFIFTPLIIIAAGIQFLILHLTVLKNFSNYMLKKILPVALLALLGSCRNIELPSLKNDSTLDPLYTNLDTTVRPGDDFFLYANGGWIKKNPIPGSESSWGIGQLVQEDIYVRLKGINELAVADGGPVGSVTQKIGDFWTSAMDSVAINNAGLQPIQTDLNKIDSAATIQNLLLLSASFKAKGSNTFFGDYIGQDDMNSEKIALMLYQGGLGMPNRDYYFDTDEKSVAVRNAFKTYLVKTFKQLGNTDSAANKMMTDVLALETRLATSSRKLAALRDPYKNYNKMSISKLQTLTPDLPWNNYLPAYGIKTLDSTIVGQPEFFTTLNKELKSTPLPIWKAYMKYNYVSDFSAFLDDTTYLNAFEYSKTVTGASEPRPRWKRVLDAEEEAMGEALGQLFAKEYFDETAKKRYEDLVENVRTAYKERIQKLDWMSDSTKAKALNKLARIKKKVGYPNKWKDFSAMQINKSPFVINMQRAHEWWHNYEINKLGKPVDRDEWGMTPQTYNAYYNPSNNEIVLPAGIFAVPGKKDADLDDALVYGYAAASTIGHEITHGFDDQGRQYDADGNLKDWWSKKDGEEFSKRAKAIIKQYDEFTPVDNLHVNGDATQGENIADLGGLLLGLDAFKKTETYKSGKKINGFTPLQRYFLGYAYSWLYSTKKERLASRLKTDVHAPAKERINGPVANVPEFYEAFGIKPGDKMYRADSLRVRIW